MLHYERHVGVDFIHRLHHCQSQLLLSLFLEVFPHAVNVAVGTALEIYPESVVGIAKHDSIFRHIGNHRHCHGVDVDTLLVVDIAVGPGGLHSINSRHETSLRVGRIAVLDNVLQGKAHLLVATLLKPVGKTTAI